MQLLNYNDFHLYQKRAVAKGVRTRGGYMFLDTGMGKTIISLAIHDQLKRRKLIQRSLILAPKFVMNNVWEQEAKKWKFSRNFTFSRIHGSTYRGSSEFSKRMAVMDDAEIHIINYEGLLWLSSYLSGNSIPFPWQCVFYDESTRMKRSTTKRFKAFKQFMAKFKYKYCLTGTPIPNGLEDIFGQSYVVDQGDSLGKGITKFRTDYMKPLFTLHGRVTIYGERNGSRKRVAAKLSDRTVRLKKTEHLDLPPINYHNIAITMPELVRTAYKTFASEFYIKLGETNIETFSQVATDMKLRQMLQGQLYDKDGNTKRIHRLKAEVVKNLKVDGNTIVAYNFKFERDDLRTATGSNHYLDSRTTDKEAEKWIIEWNNYAVKYFLVNPASAAFGLNLQAGGNNIIWYSLTWNAEHYSQLIDRLWRQGQRRPVNVYHIVFKDTIDEVIADALSRKDMDQARLMQDIVDYMKRH